MKRWLLVGTAAALLLPPTGAAAATPRGPSRILYSSDWLGPTQIFALDPTGRSPLRQVTFADPPPCGQFAIACGFVSPALSPNGRRLAYLSLPSKFDSGGGNTQVWVANADGTANRPAPRPSWYRLTLPPGGYATRSPDGRWEATANFNGIAIKNVRTGEIRQLTSKPTYELAWSPDSRSIVYAEGLTDSYTSAASGGMKIVSVDGRTRTLTAPDAPYATHISSLAWVRPAKGTRFRRPQAAQGLYAGGRVWRLAADGERVAYSACTAVTVWTPRTAARTKVRDGYPGCPSPPSRLEIQDLALAGDSVAWAEKGTGLVFNWSVMEARLDAGGPLVLAQGSNALGYPMRGGGGLTGAAGSLFYSVWTTSVPVDPTVDQRLTAATLFRAGAGGCPCPAIAYTATPWQTPPLGLTPLIASDTDGTRVVVLRNGTVALLDSTGNERLVIPERAGGAQLAGDTVVVLVPNALHLYDAATGALRRSWPLPSDSVGRDCTFYGEPQCPADAMLKLQDAARGLAAYTLDGNVHVVRLADGRDTVVARGSEARFMDDGLVYANGTRLHVKPWTELP